MTTEPLDPDSPEGQHAQRVLSELAADVLDRLEREGKPIPDCFLTPEARRSE